jgi:hypothetical protein
MKQQKNLRERYIQLVETFITAIESGKTGAELEDIRNEIRALSAKLNGNPSVENNAQVVSILQATPDAGLANNEADTAIS